jgi:hypothetical protein
MQSEDNVLPHPCPRTAIPIHRDKERAGVRELPLRIVAAWKSRMTFKTGIILEIRVKIPIFSVHPRPATIFQLF